MEYRNKLHGEEEFQLKWLRRKKKNEKVGDKINVTDSSDFSFVPLRRK